MEIHNVCADIVRIMSFMSLYPPQNGVLEEYTVFSMSEIPRFRNSVLSTFKVFAP